MGVYYLSVIDKNVVKFSIKLYIIGKQTSTNLELSLELGLNYSKSLIIEK